METKTPINLIKKLLGLFLIFTSISFCTPSIDYNTLEYINYIELSKLVTNSTTTTSTSNSTTPLTITYTNLSLVLNANTTMTNEVPTLTTNISSCTSSPALPTGLSLDSVTCTISGTPTVPQVATSYTITASNDVESATATILISVNAAPVFAVGYPGTILSFTQNGTISAQTPIITGGTVSTCSASLPPGLTINSTTCEITGTPTSASSAANYPITVTSTTGITLNISLNITVWEAAPSGLVYTGSPFIFNEAQDIGVITPSVTGNVTNCVSVPTLTAGLTIDPTTCKISGTPTTYHSATNFSITASNSGGSISTSIMITVNENIRKRIFVTSVGYVPGTDFNSASTADTKCNSAPNKPIGGTYKALISDLTRVASLSPNAGDGQTGWVLKPNTTYYKADGVTAVGTTNANALFITNFITPIFTNSKYWTGMNVDWTQKAGSNCSNWTSPTSTSSCGNASLGTPAALLDNWGSVTCGAAQQLLCVEQ
ncbi:MAG: DUF1554 domain-containing protein [Leptospiraceae bacterium]|nr:DUF1554 domain-containing protein [Leptospiraceae bacterium]